MVDVKKALEAADILIPFAIRTLDFGAKGGEKLNDMLTPNKHNEDKDKSNNKDDSDNNDTERGSD
ncbi:hypothetical protein [Paraglaciecola psychrophila]|uniref:Mechanosensitive ion channel MscS n=1 Tax=Paraglaciecola psychrophila 170 TaxID=1129794 RepID=M4RJY4_9ALTE|nr:hypothetical protein [Paraglaciecola psychrophila]AGH42903.1 mechanosensitive ion channel MscS [Paraglaciecola psychrophila 170]